MSTTPTLAPDLPLADEMDDDNEECPVLEPNQDIEDDVGDPETIPESIPNESTTGGEIDEEDVNGVDKSLAELDTQLIPINDDNVDGGEDEGEEEEIEDKESDPKPHSQGLGLGSGATTPARGGGRKVAAGSSSTRSTDSNPTNFEIVTRKRAASITTSNDDVPKAKLGRNSTSTANPGNNNNEEGKDDSSNNDGDDGSEVDPDDFHDKYCWVCHKIGVQVSCRICPRTYHQKCVPDVHVDENKSCVCYECNAVMKAENVNNRSDAMKLMTMDQLVDLLLNICSRMKVAPGADPFLNPVAREDAEDYYEYVVYPMDIGKLEKNIRNKQYGSTEAFLSDAQWIVHNSIIFNSASSPYTNCAKRLLKICKQELAEIETCPECYSNAHTNPNWFVEPCKRPHLLVWAKLKGFPFWPAKAMKIHNEQVDVRFFGQHDRAWVNLKDCFLYSIEQPGGAPKKSAQLNAAVEELNEHVEKLKEIYGEVTFAEPKKEIGPSLSVDQIRRLLPKYVGEEPSKQRVSAQVKPKPQQQQPPAKSPVTLTISSLKTNPVIKSNSAAQEEERFPVEEQEESDPDGDGEGDEAEDIEGMEVDDQEQQDQGDNLVEEQGRLTMAVDDENDEADELGNIPAAVVETSASKVGADPETAEDAKEEEAEEDSPVPRVPSGILASALGLRRVTRRQSATMDEKKVEPEPPTNPKGKSDESIGLGGFSAAAAEDDDDDEMDNDEFIEDSPVPRRTQTKAQDLMEQISSQAQTKPGYRFNISKDISISAIGDDGDEQGPTNNNPPPLQLSQQQQQQSNLKTTITTAATAIRKSLGYHVIPTNQEQQQQQRLVRPMIQAQSGAGRSIIPGGLTKATVQPQVQIVQQQQKPNLLVRPGLVATGTGQRFFLGKDGSVRPMMKPSGVGGNNPLGKPPLPQQQQQQQHQQQQVRSLIRPPNRGGIPLRPIAPKTDLSSGDLQGNHSSTSISGAITLPGGTITVTPLTPVLPTSSNSHMGIVNGQVNGISGIVKTTGPVQRRIPGGGNSGIALPQSINTQIALCMKSIQDQLRSSIESIASDIIDSGVGSPKIDQSVFLKEKDQLLIKHAKELADLRHNHEIAFRELRTSMENERRKVVNELRRQFELDKNRALEEAKKKQWCAKCGREAQFYCCWNTSYCGYQCQETHWPQHLQTCTQSKADAGTE